MIRTSLALALGFTLLAGAVASAAPVGPAARVGLDLRRTTLVVADLDASLRVYRDALGLVVTYDHMINTPPDAKSLDQMTKSRRLVLMRANDDFVGQLGLLQYFKPKVPARPGKTSPELQPGDVVLVFNTKDLKARFEKLRATPGVRIAEAPNPVTYPSYDGKGVIHVMFSSFYDPDGNYVELNEVLDDKLH